MSKYTIGIDLGGTNIVAIVTDENRNILARKKVNTPDNPTVPDTAREMFSAADTALQKVDSSWDAVANVGVAVPSSVDPQTGYVLHAPNLGWKNEDARSVFQEVFHHDVFLENDVNCGLLGEFHCGAAKGSRNAIGFFVGTGLGGGIIIDGHLYRGLRGGAGEFGHEIIRHKGRTCGCGNRGCLEAYCSKVAFGKAFDRLINEKGRKSVLTELIGTDFSRIKSKYLIQAWEQGDHVTRKVLKKGCRMLGLATANLMAILAPECVVYGGGVMEAMGEELMPYIREGLKSHLFALHPEDVDLRLSSLGDDAVPLGAVVLAEMGGNV